MTNPMRPRKIGPIMCQNYESAQESVPEKGNRRKRAVGWIKGWAERNKGETHLLLRSVGVPSVDHRDDDGESPWGSAHEKSGNVAETESSGKGRLNVSRHPYPFNQNTHEESIETESHNVGGQGEHENVDLGILESHL